MTSRRHDKRRLNRLNAEYVAAENEHTTLMWEQLAKIREEETAARNRVRQEYSTVLKVSLDRKIAAEDALKAARKKETAK